MKKILIITAFLSASAISSQAQTKPAREKKVKNFEMQDGSQITRHQREQLKEINITFKSDAEAIKKNSALSKQEKKTQLKALEDKRQMSIDLILTKEQQRKMKEEKDLRDMKRGKF